MIDRRKLIITGGGFIKQPLRILIVNNNKNLRRTLEDILRTQRFELIGVESGKEV